MFLQEIEEFVEELRDIIVRLLYQKYSFLSEQKKNDIFLIEKDYRWENLWKWIFDDFIFDFNLKFR